MMMRKEKKIKWLSVFISLTILIVGTLAYGQPEAPSRSIKIGIVGPMKFIVGENQWRGATLAAEEINAGNGVMIGGLRHSIQVVKGDTNEILSVSDAVSSLEKMITIDKVNFLIGGFRTEAILAMQEVMAAHRIIFIGCGGGAHVSLNERVGTNYDKYKYWFRLSGINSMYHFPHVIGLVDVVKNAMRKELGIQTPKVAILAEKALWVDPAVEACLKTLPKMGMEISGIWRPSPVSTDLTAELTAIRAAGSQIMYVTVTGPTGVVLSRQWGELQIPVASVGTSVESMGTRHWEATGGMCNYELISEAYGRVAMSEKTIPFFDKYLARFREYPTQSSATYDAIYLMKAAIERAATTETNAVLAELEKTDYRGALGRIAFTPRNHKWPHDVIWGPKGITWLGVQWRDGKHVAVWPDGKTVLGDKDWVGLRYDGTMDYQLPPWVVEYWKRKK
jgi:branched-chain amino acid transport system substrate-binding protein